MTAAMLEQSLLQVCRSCSRNKYVLACDDFVPGFLDQHCCQVWSNNFLAKGKELHSFKQDIQQLTQKV